MGKGRRIIITQRSRARAVLLSPEEAEIPEVMADIRAGRYTTYNKYFRKPRARGTSSH